MNRIQLRPSVQHLAEGDPHLPELMRYINWLLEGNDQQRTAHNASLLYFALVKGFAENDLIRASWAPRMVIDVGDLEFEIIISDETGLASQSLTPDRHSGNRSRSPSLISGVHTKTTQNKALLLLDALDSRHLRDIDVSSMASRIMKPLSASTHPTAPPILAGDIAMSSSPGADGVLDHLKRLEQLDRRANGLSVAINIVYWNIGTAYKEFDEGESPQIDPMHPRTVQAVLFERLCQRPGFESIAKDAAARANLNKRLQRGRKFELLVRIFGQKILSAVPEVSVSRLDGVKLEDLGALLTGSMEGMRVKRILQNLVSERDNGQASRITTVGAVEDRSSFADVQHEQ